jgi:NAD(P)-dependent dehydrogenase (short-subunit alcohol dehydrogenase family)
MPKTWLITGAARGLGAQIAKAALAAGDRVVATARKAADIEKAFPVAGEKLLAQSLDVTDTRAPETVVKAAHHRFGGVDVLVNNAGYGQLGIFEESSEDDVTRQFETNVFGLMRVTRAVLPVMRSQGSGHIINFSSIAGLIAADMCTLYGASKFAVEGFSVNLARDLAPLGIHVSIVEPGYFRTDFLDPSSAHFSGQRIGDYDEARKRSEALYEQANHHQPGDPAKLGPAILQLANAQPPPLRLLLGTDALDMVRKDMASRSLELEAWTTLSSSTDHDNAA